MLIISRYHVKQKVRLFWTGGFWTGQKDLAKVYEDTEELFKEMTRLENKTLADERIEVSST